MAKLSGLPEEIIEDAKVFMDKISDDDYFEVNKTKNIVDTIDDINTKNMDEIISITKDINVNDLTPLEAINKLNSLVERINGLA